MPPWQPVHSRERRGHDWVRPSEVRMQFYVEIPERLAACSVLVSSVRLGGPHRGATRVGVLAPVPPPRGVSRCLPVGIVL